MTTYNDEPECYVSVTDNDTDSSLNGMAAIVGMPKRWGLDTCCSVHTTPDRSIFKTYRLLTAADDRRSIDNVRGSLAPIKKSKIELKIDVNGKPRLLILDDILHIPGLPINLISQGKLMRSGCPIKIVSSGIKIGVRGITAWLIDNDIFRFNI